MGKRSTCEAALQAYCEAEGKFGPTYTYRLLAPSTAEVVLSDRFGVQVAHSVRNTKCAARKAVAAKVYHNPLLRSRLVH